MNRKAPISKLESDAVDALLRHRGIIFFVCILCMGVIARRAGQSMIAGDMKGYLVPWFDYFAERGFRGLSEQVGDYNLLYQTIIALMAQICARVPIGCVHLYKLISGVFDFLLALAGASFVADACEEKRFDFKFDLTFGLIYLLPTVVLNSGYWGQCDSAWTLFCVLTLHALYRERFGWAFAFLGLAFAFKFQAVFFLPFVFAHYFKKRTYSISLFALAVCVFWACGIVAYLYGRELTAPFHIYAAQTNTWPSMWMNYHSPWMLVGEDYKLLSKYAILVALCACGAGLNSVLQDKFRLDTTEDYLVCSSWFVWTCLALLPAMHERYTYLLDILLLLLAVCNVKYLPFFAGSAILSTITYGNYLFKIGKVTKVGALAMLVLWIAYTASCFGALGHEGIPQETYDGEEREP